MYIERLRLTTFRNYFELDLAPGAGLNILVGDNAQGKTNILEAVHLLAVTRSLRASRDSEMVRRGAEDATVAADVVRDLDSNVALEVAIAENDKKTVRINTVRRPRVLELVGCLNVVHFGSIDLDTVAGEPAFRRRWMNLEISQISPKYCFDLAGYKKVLEQRNRLLRDLRDRPLVNAGLDVWNEQLVRYGAPIIEKRRFFMEQIAPLASDIHTELTRGAEELSIRYVPSIAVAVEAAIAETMDTMRAQIAALQQEEIRRGVTLAGPQRDDAQFLINGEDARTFGSLGQQRTVVLSLKLAELKLMREYVGESPVLLLDDVMSDLDDLRRSHLLQKVGCGQQTFVTCTNLRDFPAEMLLDANIYHVEGGKVSPYGASLPSAVPNPREVVAP